jgi:hypothetical protein
VTRLLGLVLSLVPALACGKRNESPRAYPADAPPPELAAGAAAAGAAIQKLQQQLVARLTAELQRGGPVGAVGVCRAEAEAITAEVARTSGIAVGRTSHRLRNPRNTPPPWVRAEVAAAAGKQATDVQARVFDLGDRVGLLRPIPTMALCTTCHGAPEQMAPELLATLRTAYPDDQATGFREGDLRGFVWAEAPR